VPLPATRLGIRNYFYVCLSETLVSTRSRVGASHINLPRLKEKKKEEKMKKTNEEGAANTDMVQDGVMYWQPGGDEPHV
jgi:hypothetical protein